MRLLSRYITGMFSRTRFSPEQEQIIEELFDTFDMRESDVRGDIMEFLMDAGINPTEAVLLANEAYARFYGNANGRRPKASEEAVSACKQVPRLGDSEALVSSYSVLLDTVNIAIERGVWTLSQAKEQIVTLCEAGEGGKAFETRPLLSFLGLGSDTDDSSDDLSDAAAEGEDDDEDFTLAANDDGDGFSLTDLEALTSAVAEPTFKGLPTLKKICTVLPSGDCSDVINILKYYATGAISEVQARIHLKTHNITEKDCNKLLIEFNKFYEKHHDNKLDSPLVEDSVWMDKLPVLSAAPQKRRIRINVRKYYDKGRLPFMRDVLSKETFNAHEDRLLDFGQMFADGKLTDTQFYSELNKIGISNMDSNRIVREFTQLQAHLQKNPPLRVKVGAAVGNKLKQLPGAAMDVAGGLGGAVDDIARGDIFKPLDDAGNWAWNKMRAAVTPKKSTYSSADADAIAGAFVKYARHEIPISEVYSVLSNYDISDDDILKMMEQILPSVIKSEVYKANAIKDPTGEIKKSFATGVMDFKEAVKALSEYYQEVRGAAKEISDKYATNVVHSWLPKNGPPPEPPKSTQPKKVVPNVPMQSPEQAAVNPVMPSDDLSLDLPDPALGPEEPNVPLAPPPRKPVRPLVRENYYNYVDFFKSRGYDEATSETLASGRTQSVPPPSGSFMVSDVRLGIDLPGKYVTGEEFFGEPLYSDKKYYVLQFADEMNDGASTISFIPSDYDPSEMDEVINKAVARYKIHSKIDITTDLPPIAAKEAEMSPALKRHWPKIKEYLSDLRRADVKARDIVIARLQRVFPWLTPDLAKEAHYQFFFVGSDVKAKSPGINSGIEDLLDGPAAAALTLLEEEPKVIGTIGAENPEQPGGPDGELSSEAMSRAVMAYIAFSFRNSLHHIHLHLVGDGQLPYHRYIEELYEKAIEDADYFAERAIQEGESLDNFNNIANHPIVTSFPDATDDSYTLRDFAEKFTFIGNAYLKALMDLRGHMPPNIQSDIDQMYSYWDNAVNYLTKQLLEGLSEAEQVSDEPNPEALQSAEVSLIEAN